MIEVLIFVIGFLFGMLFTSFGVNYLKIVGQLDLYLDSPNKILTWPVLFVQRMIKGDN